MKKQILLFILVFFTGVTVTWGQAMPGSAPRPLVNCVTGPLNPIAGVPYDYEANATPTGGNAYWYATLSTQFTAAGARVATEEAVGGTVVAAADTNYRALVGPTANPFGTTITWTSEGLAAVDATNPLFVVVEYESPDCADNIKVYRIDPMNAFLVNVLNLGEVYDDDAESCFADVAAAAYNTATSEVEYDFGENTMAFEVIAANFTGSYTPSFRIDGLQNNQEAEILWSVTNDIGTAASVGTLSADGTIAGTAVNAGVTDTSNGVSIFVWVVVSNYDFEGLTTTPITLAVAGTNSAGQPNVRWNDCSIEVDLAAAFADNDAPDYAIHNLLPRPTVTPEAPLNFEDQRTP